MQVRAVELLGGEAGGKLTPGLWPRGRRSSGHKLRCVSAWLLPHMDHGVGMRELHFTEEESEEEPKEIPLGS